MIPAEFQYLCPSSVDEAVRMLADAGEDAKVIAGGQSLVPVLRMRLAAPTALIDLGGLTELTGVRDDGDSLLIGAMTTHYEVQRDHLIHDHARLLELVTDTVADPQVRHRGTFGGSLCHADPAGDLLAPALALDCVMIIAGPGGRREVPASEFFTDYFDDRAGPGRDPDRRPGAEVHRLGCALREAQPGRAGVVDRRGRGGRAGQRRHDRCRSGRPDQRRRRPAACRRRRGGSGRPARVRRGDLRGGSAGVLGRGLQGQPGSGADRPCADGGGLADEAVAFVRGAGPGRGGLGGAARSGTRGAVPAGRHR